jgi:hypothetical protein
VDPPLFFDQCIEDSVESLTLFLAGSVYSRRFHRELLILEFSLQVTEEADSNSPRTNKISILSQLTRNYYQPNLTLN